MIVGEIQNTYLTQIFIQTLAGNVCSCILFHFFQTFFVGGFSLRQVKQLRPLMHFCDVSLPSIGISTYSFSIRSYYMELFIKSFHFHFVFSICFFFVFFLPHYFLYFYISFCDYLFISVCTFLLLFSSPLCIPYSLSFLPSSYPLFLFSPHSNSFFLFPPPSSLSRSLSTIVYSLLIKLIFPLPFIAFS